MTDPIEVAEQALAPYGDPGAAREVIAAWLEAVGMTSERLRGLTNIVGEVEPMWLPEWVRAVREVEQA